MLRRGSSAEALGRVEEALAQFPNSSRLEEVRARALAKTGRIEEAVKAYAETYRKAMQRGAEDRANRAYKEAFSLARENGDLMLDLAAIVGSAGGAGLAIAATKTAIDIYRRRNERPRLLDALKHLRLMDPGDSQVDEEIQRTEREMSISAPPAPQHAVPPPPSSPQSPGQLYDRVSPPKTQRAAPAPPPRTVPSGTTSELDDEWRRQRATKTNLNAPPRVPSRKAEPSQLGAAMVIGSIIVLLIALASGVGVPGLIGGFVTHAYIKASENLAGAKNLQAAKAARTICFIAFVLGIFIR